MLYEVITAQADLEYRARRIGNERRGVIEADVLRLQARNHRNNFV